MDLKMNGLHSVPLLKKEKIKNTFSNFRSDSPQILSLR